MRSDKPKALSNVNMRQRVTAVALVIVVVIILWQIIGLFRGPSVSTPPAKVVATGNQPPVPAPQPATPQPAPLPQRQPTTAAELQLMQLQQETEAKYIAAINEIQMLKLEREIAETNQAIAAAKLATVTAQKSLITLLTPPSAPVVTTSTTYSPNLVNPAPTVPTTDGTTVITAPPAPTTPTPPPVPGEQPFIANYSVISVSKLLNRWRAVMGFQGNLYQVQVGDVLPPDQSKVVSISNTGVVLQKDGTTRKVSLVPII